LHGSGQGPTKQGAAPKAPEPPVDKAATEAV
jgi:two-component system chemotaxis sensor kinase CheA